MCQEFAVIKRKAMNDVGKRFCNGQFLTELSKRVFHEQGHHEIVAQMRRTKRLQRLLLKLRSCYLPAKRMLTNCSEKFKHHVSIHFVRLVVGVMLVMSVSVDVKAWKTIDRAYVDKTFSGHNWFRYRENALHNEPMNTREETYMAIRKMFATLDDHFTHFLEPDKFNSVGSSIGYPTRFDGSPAGLLYVDMLYRGGRCHFYEFDCYCYPL
ncbi:hypothetical protein AAG906_010050 [Vitis piasezkii]